MNRHDEKTFGLILFIKEKLITLIVKLKRPKRLIEKLQGRLKNLTGKKLKRNCKKVLILDKRNQFGSQFQRQDHYNFLIFGIKWLGHAVLVWLDSK